MAVEGRVRNIVLRDALPVLGLSPLWTLMRNVPFVAYVYPVGMGGAGIEPSYSLLVRVAVLLALVLLVAGTLAARGWVERFVTGRRAGAAALMALGAVGMAVATGGASSGLLLGVACILVSVSFLAGTLCWAAYFTRPFCARRLAEVGLSFLVNYALFPAVGVVARLFGAAVPLVAAPLVMGACWLLCEPRLDVEARPQPSRDLLLDPFVVATAAIVVLGSFVRGVADSMAGVVPVRYMLSVPATIVFAGACVAVALRSRVAGGLGAADGKMAARFVSACWAALVALMLVGLVWFFVGDARQGADVVAVAQFLLAMLLWIILCFQVQATGVDAVPLFLAWYLGVQAASWVVRYALVPALVGDLTSAGLLGADEAVALALVVAAGPFAIGYGCRRAAASLSGSRAPVPAPAAACAGQGGPGGEEPATPERESRGLADLADACRLTPREIQVGELYAQGYSIGKVAEQLGITVATAQSHMRSVYRKLDVHSKDDFIRVARGEA